MSKKILLRRGLYANLPTLSEGEPGFCTDTHGLYVGSAAGNKKINHGNVGAYGDGSTDDRAAIQAAINNNGTVFLPNGHYKMGGTLNYKSGLHIIGESRAGTIIEPAVETIAAFTMTGDVTEWSLQNLTINYGPATGNVASAVSTAKGIKLLKSGATMPFHFSIRDVTVLYSYNGIYNDDLAFMYDLTNVRIQNAGHYGINLPLATAGTTAVMNNVWVNDAKGGFYITNLSGLVMNACGSDNISKGNTINLFTSCNATLNQFMVEACTLDDHCGLLIVAGGQMVLNGYKGTGNIYDEAGGAESYGIRGSDDARIIISNAYNTGETHSGAGFCYALMGSSNVGHIFVLGHGIAAPTGGSTTGIYAANNKVTIFDTQKLSLYDDIAVRQQGKGIVLINAAGNVTKRVRLNDAGDGLLYEAE